ncbi:MAG: hypothetical protein IKE23_11095 [Exiguobacterium sp.]|nr:hypothetical protein [Exiguobacterium sp.]
MMRVRWVKIWIDPMATLTERFRKEDGSIDFEALGREEYEFRHALIVGDFAKSARAKEAADQAAKDFKYHSENGKKGGRPAKNLSADGDTREGSQNESDGRDAANMETSSSADTGTLDSLTDKDARPVDGRATSKPSRTTLPQNTYGEFNNVKMTTAEFEKFVQAVGADRANALIEELSSYLASSGKRYKSHYATLLNWGRRKDTDASKGKKSFKQIERDERTNFFKDDSVVKKMMAEKMGEVG